MTGTEFGSSFLTSLADRIEFYTYMVTRRIPNSFYPAFLSKPLSFILVLFDQAFHLLSGVSKFLVSHNLWDTVIIVYDRSDIMANVISGARFTTKLPKSRSLPCRVTFGGVHRKLDVGNYSVHEVRSFPTRTAKRDLRLRFFSLSRISLWRIHWR